MTADLPVLGPDDNVDRPAQWPLVSHTRTSPQTNPTLTRVTELAAVLMLRQLPIMAGVLHSAWAGAAVAMVAPTAPAMAIVMASSSLISLFRVVVT